MAADRKSDFGSKLRAARERRGVSLRQIAAATKISVSALEALEKNEISRLPGGIFSRAFVRAYAVEIGLDPEEAIQDFIEQFPQDSVTAGHPQSHPVEEFETLESERRTASTFLKLVAISLPIAGAVLYFGIAGRRKAATEALTHAASQPPLEVAVPIDSAPPPATAVASPPPLAEPALDRLSVEVVAQRACSVTATIDGSTRPEQTLGAGDRQTYDAARELLLRIGDAGAVTWTVNGETARPLGAAGQVVTVHLTPANYKEYVIPR